MLHCSCLHCSFSCLHCLFRILLCIDAVCSQVSSFTGVPTMMRDMMEHPSFTVDRVASLKSLAAGGLTAQTLIIAPLILILSLLTLLLLCLPLSHCHCVTATVSLHCLPLSQCSDLNNCPSHTDSLHDSLCAHSHCFCSLCQCSLCQCSVCRFLTPWWRTSAVSTTLSLHHCLCISLPLYYIVSLDGVQAVHQCLHLK